jgi:hypothetical protein
MVGFFNNVQPPDCAITQRTMALSGNGYPGRGALMWVAGNGSQVMERVKTRAPGRPVCQSVKCKSRDAVSLKRTRSVKVGRMRGSNGRHPSRRPHTRPVDSA